MIWCPYAFRNLMVQADMTYRTCCYGQAPSTLNRTVYPTVKEAFYSKEIESIRENLRNGIRDSNCQRCWELEDQGVESLRLQEIRTDDASKDLINEPKLEQIFLSLGNQCNLKCRTCDPHESSQWVQEIQQTDKVVFPMYLEPENSDFYQGLKNDVLPNLKEVVFTGGEPLLLKSTNKILDLLDPSVFVTIITNGTFKLPETLNKFDEVSVFASVDGIGDKFNYMRHPGNWDQVKENLISMKDKISMVTCTATAYNVYYIDEVEEFAKSIGVDFYAHILYSPENLSVHVYPDDIREVIIEKLKINPSMQKDKIIGHLREKTYLDFDSFSAEVRKRDKIRGEDFKTTFPEFYSILERHGKTI